MFRTAARDVRVHVWADRDPEVERHLAFRDQLRRSPEGRDAYARLERELAAPEWDDMNDHADAKGDLIQAIVARAAGADRDARLHDFGLSEMTCW
jgi:GrpB-like predicted nucleotidyltransferase (UPF0157 family)